MSLTGYEDPGAVASSDIGDVVRANKVRNNDVAFAGFFTTGHYVDYSGTTVTVTNTTDATPILTYTIPGGDLGTNNMVRFRMMMTAYNGFGDQTSGVLSMDYGSTTVVSGVGAVGGTATSDDPVEGDWMVEGYIKNMGATSNQRGHLHIPYSDSEVIIEDLYGDNGTAAEDSTGDLDLVVNFTWVNADTDLTASMIWYTIEYMQE